MPLPITLLLRLSMLTLIFAAAAMPLMRRFAAIFRHAIRRLSFRAHTARHYADAVYADAAAALFRRYAAFIC